jgi:23S rRNA pseudouridine2604 synthase
MLTTRLNKFISESGYCSRRAADLLIEQGRVFVNGKRPELGSKVNASDEITIDGKTLPAKRERIYIAFNKPRGVTCTTELHVKGNIISFIRFPERIFPIGRLDKDSEGLIFLTNDGDIVNKILRAGNDHEKEYLVTVDKSISSSFVENMSNGVPVLDTVTKKCRIVKETEYRFRIILTQGINRQIRRMCEALGYHVEKLKRVRIMNIHLNGIAEGQWRSFTKEEVKRINELVAASVKTEEASQAGNLRIFGES